MQLPREVQTDCATVSMHLCERLPISGTGSLIREMRQQQGAGVMRRNFLGIEVDPDFREAERLQDSRSVEPLIPLRWTMMQRPLVEAMVQTLSTDGQVHLRKYYTQDFDSSLP